MNSFIALAGFMGTGKTTTGRILAQKLGWAFVDTDDWIQQKAGKSIPRLFSEDGEAAFRSLEREALETLAAPETVMATGGGAILDPENRRILARGLTFVLDAPLDVIRLRIQATDRPLAHQMDALYTQRLSLYGQFPYHLDANQPPEIIVEAILGVLNAPVEKLSVCASRTYPILIENASLSKLGERLKAETACQKAFVVSDTQVWSLYGEMVLASLCGAGLAPVFEVIPVGETSKSLETAQHLYTRMLEAHLDRRTPVVALGGGVVGDLAGFVASTYQRGVPFYQVPTSLLAQVDSSVGGKVAVNHPLGKNMIGCFYQPQGVLIDPMVLRTLPDREWRCGLAELVKYGVILDAQLFEGIENNLEAILRREPGVVIPLIARACELKAQVVNQDEREEGLRAILNFGHTIGHAIEATAGFGLLTHGEAVAIGMVKASEISVLLGKASSAETSRLKGLLERAGLQTSALGFPAEAIVEAMRTDKKNRLGSIRMVLPVRIGQVELPQPVEEDLIRSSLQT